MHPVKMAPFDSAGDKPIRHWPGSSDLATLGVSRFESKHFFASVCSESGFAG